MGKSQRNNKKILDIFLPGMITAYGYKGRFPAISITGSSCALGCEHCKGYLLESMFHARTPEKLIHLLKRFKERGMLGVLLSGGCDKNGRMPWEKFLPALTKFETDLYLIAHGGMNISKDLAMWFKNTPIKEVLIDVVGDQETLRSVYHIDDFSIMEDTLENVYSSGLKVAPHVIVGIHRGKIKGEFNALDMVARFQKEHIILVVLMPEIMNVKEPPIQDVLDVFTYARRIFNRVTLGCARPRGKYRRELEKKLIERNLIDAMALWSHESIKKALELGYTVNFYEGCCSIPLREHIPVLEQFNSVRVL